MSGRGVCSPQPRVRRLAGVAYPRSRVRRQGGARKKAVEKDTAIRSDLEGLLESTTRGDPEAPLRWTCKSVRQLTSELTRMKHRVSHQGGADLVHGLGYSLQGN